MKMEQSDRKNDISHFNFKIFCSSVVNLAQMKNTPTPSYKDE